MSVTDCLAKSTFSVVTGGPAPILSANAEDDWPNLHCNLAALLCLSSSFITVSPFSVAACLYFSLSLKKVNPLLLQLSCHFRRYQSSLSSVLEDGLFLSALNSVDVSVWQQIILTSHFAEDFISFRRNPKYYR